MRRMNGQPFGPSALLGRLRRLRLWLAARRYAARGWPVLTDDHFATDAGRTLRLATGLRFDALEVSGTLGLRMLGTARLHAGLDLPDLRGPVLVTPSGSWLFLVRPGTPLRSELDGAGVVVRHGRGSWIPAAPSRTLQGPVRWVVPPERVGWRLPAAAGVQSMLLTGAAREPGTPIRRPAVPRQLSTTRRAL